MADANYQGKDDREATAKAGPGIGSNLSNRDKYIIYLAAAVILLVIAAAVTLAEGHSTPLSRCKGILLGNQRNACLANLALATDNASVCALIGPGSQPCVVDVAEHYKNQSACGILANGTYKYQCTLNISLAVGSPVACAYLGNYSSQCYYSYAEHGKFSNITMCSLIGNSTESAYCDAIGNYNLAVTSGKQNYCTKVPNAADSNLLFLLLNYSALGANSTSYLYYAYYNFTPQEYCYFNLALKFNESAACNILPGTIGSVCNEYLTELSQQPNSTANGTKNSTQLFNLTATLSSCNALPASLQSICITGAYATAATLNGNVTFCTDLQNPQYITTCIDSLVQYYNSTSYCAYITNSSAQESCYLQ